MKVKVLLNRVKINYQDDFQKAKEYFAKHGLPIEWEFETTDIKDYEVKSINYGSVGYRLQIVGHEKHITLSKDHITIFVFNGNEYPLAQIPASRYERTPDGVLITLMTYSQGDSVGETYRTLLHEMMHAIIGQLFYKAIYLNDPMDVMFRDGKYLYYYKDHAPDALDGNFAEAWKGIKPHLSKLYGLTSVNQWKYFRPEEKTGSTGIIADLNPTLVDKLDKARMMAGIPFIINSGKRSTDHNSEVGGVESSSHLTGEAVDIRARNSNEHFLITKALMDAGFKRISRKYTNHIHCDIAQDKLQNVLF